MPKFELPANVLSPMGDRVFKLLLTHPDSKDALMDIISCVIKRKVTDVVVKNNELPALGAEEKQARLDVNCTIDGGEQVDLEMQASRMAEKAGNKHKNLKNKGLYYLCDLLTAQSVKGKAYDELARTYQVMLCGYTVFPKKENFLHEFNMRDDEGELLSDTVNMVFVELSKLKKALNKPVSEMTPLEMWSIFFKYADNPAHRDAVNRIVGAKGEIEMAWESLISISQDERERAILRSRRMYQTDMESDKRTIARESEAKGRAEGEAKGRAEGEAKGKLEVAANLKRMGASLHQIAEATGLPIEDIEKL